jgi:hypothetical protein
MAGNLKGISTKYDFFCAYLAQDDPAELLCVNGLMLSNFI